MISPKPPTPSPLTAIKLDLREGSARLAQLADLVEEVEQKRIGPAQREHGVRSEEEVIGATSVATVQLGQLAHRLFLVLEKELTRFIPALKPNPTRK